jgi:hypothetical protein
MNDHYDPYTQAQHEQKVRRMVRTLVLGHILGGVMGTCTVLLMTGTWSFTFDFLSGYILTATCLVLLLVGALWLRFPIRQNMQQENVKGIVLKQGDLTEFDRLVEQQDQEIALHGHVSPFTQVQLHAYAEGKPVPHVGVHSPELERLTRELVRGKAARTPMAAAHRR